MCHVDCRKENALKLLKTVLTYAALFCVGAVTSVACIEPDLGDPSFRCNPAQAAKTGESGCPEEQTCCSDDPATIGGKVPNYFKDGTNDSRYGTPLFSDLNNSLSTQGMCVTLGFDSPLINGCPVPCNPTWDPADIVEICGPTAQCCQTQELDPAKDCILDGDRWRAATGADVLAQPQRSGWGGQHTTNQDPNAAGCKTFATGTPGVEPMGEAQNAAFRDCISQLSVANQRGFCYAFGCPCIEDVCGQKNADYVPKCTAAAPPMM